MGTKLALGSAFTDTTLPVLTEDPIVSNGTLLLIDPTHPAGAIPAGVPAAGDRFPNIAQGAARNVLGNPSAEVRPQLVFGAGWQGGDGALLRSTKGGLHGVVDNPLAGAASERGFGLKVPSAIAAHIVAHPDHDYFVSLWGRITRVAGEANAGLMPALSLLGQPGSLTATYLHRFSAGITRPNTSGTTTVALGQRAQNLPDALGNFHVNVGVPNVTQGGVPPTDFSATRIANWGILLEVGSVKGLSWIFYRFMLEDLTVSGRTYGQIDALDRAAYVAQVETAGGRYNGDTFTDPATI